MKFGTLMAAALFVGSAALAAPMAVNGGADQGAFIVTADGGKTTAQDTGKSGQGQDTGKSGQGQDTGKSGPGQDA